MTSFNIEITINQPVSIVDKALMNPDNHPLWMKDLVKFETIKGSPGEVGSIARVETILLSSGNNTEISIKWSGQGKTFMLKLMLPVLRRKLVKQSKSELEVFKQLVETRGPDFTKGD